TADLSERPVVWHRVARIPFGPRESELGMLPAGRYEVAPVVPFSFAVAANGSLWFLDEVKHRLAHFGVGGSFLGAIGGVAFDRFHPRARDVVMEGAGPILLEDGLRHEGIVATPRPGGGFTSAVTHDAAGPVHVSGLIQTSPQARSRTPVAGSVEGRPFVPGDTIERRPQGVADLGLPG